ncbi:MAG: glycosyltransferase family 4 protein [Desulfovibrionaceae bacterium]|nr:glycosyltransferase family 4 protein [Desulfovibrionaceae bacterium]
MKILILYNQARSLANFWTFFIRRLHELGHQTVCCIPESEINDPAVQLLQNIGASVRFFPLDSKGLNPIRDLKSCLRLTAIFHKEKPDLLYAATIKPVVYGLPAARLAGIPARYAMITGLGYMFEADTLRKKLLSFLAAALYRFSCSFAHTVFFQNSDDIAVFRRMHCISPETNILLTRGTGVDTRHFAFQPHQRHQNVVFLFVGRLLEAKGLRDFAEAAKITAKLHPQAIFQVLGPYDDSPAGIHKSEIAKWEQDGILTYLGETRDVRPFLEKADVVVLPSWREGLPCSLMEAMSTGRAVIASDAPGCRDVVSNGQNGFLIPVKNAEALAEAMSHFLRHPELIERMGSTGRSMAEQTFSADIATDILLRRMNLL